MVYLEETLLLHDHRAQNNANDSIFPNEALIQGFTQLKVLVIKLLKDWPWKQLHYRLKQWLSFQRRWLKPSKIFDFLFGLLLFDMAR